MKTTNVLEEGAARTADAREAYRRLRARGAKPDQIEVTQTRYANGYVVGFRWKGTGITEEGKIVANDPSALAYLGRYVAKTESK